MAGAYVLQVDPSSGDYTRIQLAQVATTGAAADITGLTAAVTAVRLDQLAAPTAAVSLNSQKITSLATPTSSSDGATKGYVDAALLSTAINTLTNSAGTVTLDLSLAGNLFQLLGMTANVSTLTITNPPATGFARTVDITVSQDATGGRTFALPASWKAIGGSDTAIQSAASAKTKIVATIYHDGSAEYSMAVVAP